jgi:hypothetical protein
MFAVESHTHYIVHFVVRGGYAPLFGGTVDPEKQGKLWKTLTSNALSRASKPPYAPSAAL